jgi:hypothetical protein
MMRFVVRRAASIALVLLAAAALAHAGERDRLNACKELVDRAAQARIAGTAPAAAADDAKLQQCRQIIKEWTLRDSRMSVDENGRPLR